jgi:hypothetical protein
VAFFILACQNGNAVYHLFSNKGNSSCYVAKPFKNVILFYVLIRTGAIP